MDTFSWISLLILLCLSAFFSGSETSFFSLNKIQLKKMEASPKKGERRILQLLKNSNFLLISILTGNTLVNIAFSSKTTVLALELQEKFGWKISDSGILIIQILVTTFVILIFGEIVPKLIAYSLAENFAKKASTPLAIFQLILWPILKLFELFNNLISKNNSVNYRQQQLLTSEDFKNIINSENSDHPLEDSEKKIIASILQFSSTEVREIIVPRVDIVAVDMNDSLEELRQKISDSGFSRIPVHKNTIDEIIGVINAKDIILYPEKKSIKQLVRPAYFVTENMKIQTLLNQFKSKKIQIAIVVDEYGGTSGLISLEDILEELVGEIHDEYDSDVMPAFRKISDNEYVVSGMYSVADFNNEFNQSINTDEFDNLADYLLVQFNHLPETNECITINELEFKIVEIKNQRINYVQVNTLAQLVESEE
ncbi:MAG: HlyC/CorC family transporter [Candidatus Cloacimonetes bacterium]|nr:HlyC/CorC family transporter [Candidatus Cloacimonadota bacterium]